VEGNVNRADLSKQPFTIDLGSEVIETRTVIIASGASAKLLGLESERKLLGHGVSTCATCDAYFFRGKDVVVVGGGDTAAEDALFLTKFARDSLRRQRSCRTTSSGMTRFTLYGNRSSRIFSIRAGAR
jgi:thioredoxin reductase